MGGKHLKRMRAEKAKVHLKKKKLPKGQNITDTTFKVKKILTVEQLKAVDKDEPVSNWNVPLKDLLIRLNHYNFTSRLNGLNGIRELLTNYPEILQGPSLKSLISRLLDLLTDDEHKIRISAMDLLSYLFDLVPLSALIPFHDLINVYLGCAMTHRNASVQRDSLKFIDVMIKYSPEALKQNFSNITQNFIRIVKKILSEPQGMSSTGSKQDLEKVKAEMFSRFYNFMTTGLSDVTVANQSFCKNINASSFAGEKISLRQSNNQYKQIPDLSSLFMGSGNKNATLGEHNYEEFQSLCSLIAPLLFETWIECSPDRKPNETATECVLSESVAALLCIILKILMALYERAVALGAQMECWFTSAYGSTFIKCFTNNFPYSLSNSKRRSSLNKSSEFERPSCVLQNLIICFLSYSFRIFGKNKSLRPVVENYISWALSKKNPIEIEVLSKVVEAALSTSKNENRNPILMKVVNAYDATQNPELRQELSKALTKIVLSESEDVWQNEESISHWTRSLPDQICKTPILKEVVEAVSQLVNRPAGADVLHEIEGKACEIINDIHSLKVEGMSEFEGQKMIANILYRCNNEVLQKLLNEEILSNSQCSQNLKDYMGNIFHHKLLAQWKFCLL